MIELPVTLPPGCAKLLTSPSRTGTAELKMTIQTVVVAFFAARAPGVSRWAG